MVDKQMSEKDASSVISATRQSIIDSPPRLLCSHPYTHLRLRTPSRPPRLSLRLGRVYLISIRKANVWRPETRSPAPAAVCFGRRCVGLHTKRSWTIGKMPIVLPYPIRHHLSMHLRATISSIQCHGHTAVRPHPRALPVAVDPVIPRCASVAPDGRWHPLARTCTPRPDLEYMYPNTVCTPPHCQAHFVRHRRYHRAFVGLLGDRPTAVSRPESQTNLAVHLLLSTTLAPITCLDSGEPKSGLRIRPCA